MDHINQTLADQKQNQVIMGLALLKAVRCRDDVGVKQLLAAWHHLIDAKQDAKLGLKILGNLVKCMTVEEVSYMEGLY